MEVLPLPVLAELLAMLPYRDFVKFERVSKVLRKRITENASLPASFVNMRFDLPSEVRLLQTSFAQLKQVVKTLYSKCSGLFMSQVYGSNHLQVNSHYSSSRTNMLSVGLSLGEMACVVTSLSFYQPRGQGLTVLVLVSLEPALQPAVEEYASLFAQANTSEAVLLLEQAGLLRVTACYDFEAAWKLLAVRGTGNLRPVVWLQLAPDFTETVTLELSHPVLARSIYLYPIGTNRCIAYISARGAKLEFVAKPC